MNKEIILRLVKLAGDLDAKGAYAFADQITKVAQAQFQSMDESPTSPAAVPTPMIMAKLRSVTQDVGWAKYFIDNFAQGGVTEDLDSKIAAWIRVIKTWKTLSRELGQSETFEAWMNSPEMKYWANPPDDDPIRGFYVTNRIFPERQGKMWPQGFNLSEIFPFMLKATERATAKLPPRGSTGVDSAVSQQEAEPVRPTPKSVRNWQEYINAGSQEEKEYRGQVANLWKEVTNFDKEFIPTSYHKYDESFGSFVKWYNETGKPTLEGAWANLTNLLNGAKLKKERMGAVETAAAPAAKDHVFEADSMDDVVKSANINSLFWNGTSKTPFGR